MPLSPAILRLQSALTNGSQPNNSQMGGQLYSSEEQLHRPDSGLAGTSKPSTLSLLLSAQSSSCMLVSDTERVSGSKIQSRDMIYDVVGEDDHNNNKDGASVVLMDEAHGIAKDTTTDENDEDTDLRLKTVAVISARGSKTLSHFEHSTTDDERDDEENQYAGLRKQLDFLVQLNDELTRKVHELTQEKADLLGANESLADDVQQLKAELADQIQTRDCHIQSLQAQLDEKTQLLSTVKQNSRMSSRTSSYNDFEDGGYLKVGMIPYGTPRRKSSQIPQLETTVELCENDGSPGEDSHMTALEFLQCCSPDAACSEDIDQPRTQLPAVSKQASQVSIYIAPKKKRWSFFSKSPKISKSQQMSRKKQKQTQQRKAHGSVSKKMEKKVSKDATEYMRRRSSSSNEEQKQRRMSADTATDGRTETSSTDTHQTAAEDNESTPVHQTSTSNAQEEDTKTDGTKTQEASDDDEAARLARRRELAEKRAKAKANRQAEEERVLNEVLSLIDELEE